MGPADSEKCPYPYQCEVPVNLRLAKHFVGVSTEGAIGEELSKRCLDALQNSSGKETLATVPAHCLGFAERWLVRSLEICHQLLEQEGLASEIESARNALGPMIGSGEDHGGPVSLLEEYLELEYLLNITRKVIAEYKTKNQGDEAASAALSRCVDEAEASNCTREVCCMSIGKGAKGALVAGVLFAAEGVGSWAQIIPPVLAA